MKFLFSCDVFSLLFPPTGGWRQERSEPYLSVLLPPSSATPTHSAEYIYTTYHIERGIFEG